MLNLINDKQAKTNIKSIKVTGAKIDNLIHITGLFAINQVNAHGNTNFVNQLISAMPQSGRKEALIVWLRDHAKIVLNSKDNTFTYRKDRKLYDTQAEAGLVEITIEQALENANKIPFYAYTKEAKPTTSYDVLTRLDSLIKSAKAFKGDVKHAELLATLEAIRDAGKAGDTIEVKGETVTE